MKKSFQIFLIYLMFSHFSYAQDVILSDYKLYPMQLNPAFAGNGNGIRISTFVQKFLSPILGSNDLTTFGASVDAPIKLRKNLSLGLGYQYFQDTNGEVNLGTKSHKLATSLSKEVMKSNIKHTFTIGVESGLSNRSLDEKYLRWPSQIGPNGFDPTLPSGEPGFLYTVNYFDMNVGLNYSAEWYEKYSIDAGFAINHLTSPTFTFHSSTNTLAKRYTYYINPVIMITSKTGITASMFYTSQGSNNSFIASFGPKFQLNKTVESVGFNIGYHKYGYPFFGYSMKLGNLQIGTNAAFSEDWDVRKLEGFLSYTFSKKEKL